MKKTIKSKQLAEQELRDNEFVFGWLTPVTSTFNVDSWVHPPEVGTYKHFTLLLKRITNTVSRRVIKTSAGEYYYLTN